MYPAKPLSSTVLRYQFHLSEPVAISGSSLRSIVSIMRCSLLFQKHNVAVMDERKIDILIYLKLVNCSKYLGECCCVDDYDGFLKPRLISIKL